MQRVRGEGRERGEVKPSVRFSLHCLCGAGCAGTVSKAGLPKILASWKEVHSGEGHSECMARRAAYARRKAEEAEVRRVNLSL